MSLINYDDVKAQLESAGLILDKELTFDARIQRWKVLDDPHERRGWTRLKEWTSKAGNTFIVGAFGIWQGNDDGYTKLEMPKRDDNTPALTQEDKAAIQASQKETARKLAEERKAEAKTAARWASTVWSKCQPCEAHDYLTVKRIQPHGLRVLGDLDSLVIQGLDDSNHYRLRVANGALVVPMHDVNGNVCGLQFVYPKGHERRRKLQRDKEFWPSGMAMGGTFGLIGGVRRTGVMLIGEGYATAATLHEATGYSVAYAFSANNLTKAGKLIRKAYPKLHLLFCADDDYQTKENPGVTAAVNATAEIEHSAWLKPDFLDADGVDLREGKKLTDFNDLFILTGVHLTVANQVNAKLDALTWRDSSSAQRELSLPGGEGRRAAVSVMSLDEAVARFVPLDDGTGKYLFDTWTNKVCHRDQMVALLPAGVRGDDIKRHPDWIARGAYYLDQVGFDPGGNDKLVMLNTWRGWPMQPKLGKCDMMLCTLEYLCSAENNQRDVFNWILRWLAYPLQNPGAKMSSAIILHGPQGTGKSAFFQAYAKIFGDYSTVLNQRGLEDKFNADWSDSKLFILAEEVVTRAEMWHIKNELKELVTGEWIRVNPKNVAAYRQRNQVNIVYLSNENQPLPIDNDDRRHLVVRTPPPMDEEFYDKLFLEQENGGIEAFYDYLLKLDLGDFHPKKRPPMTDSKVNLIQLSLPSEARFINEWISGEMGYPVCPCPSMDLYGAYMKWCKVNGETRPRASNQFLNFVGNLEGWTIGVKRVYEVKDSTCSGNTYPKRMAIPEEGILQKSGYQKQPNFTDAEWLHKCMCDFKNAEESRIEWKEQA